MEKRNFTDSKSRSRFFVGNFEPFKNDFPQFSQWTNDLFYPVLAAPMTYPVYQTGTEHSKCAMTVFVQGDPENLKGKIVRRQIQISNIFAPNPSEFRPSSLSMTWAAAIEAWSDLPIV